MRTACLFLLCLPVMLPGPDLGAQEGDPIVEEELPASQAPPAGGDLEELAEQLFAEDDLDGAIAVYRQLVARETVAAEKARLLVLVAFIDHYAGRDAEAFSTLKKALILDPGREVRAELYTERFHELYVEALPEAERELDLKAYEAFSRGREHMQAKEYAAARSAFLEALAYRSVHPEALYNLGLTDLYDGRYDKSLDSFQKLLTLADVHPDETGPVMRCRALTNMGYLYSRRQLFQEAETALEQAVVLDPEYATAWSNLGAARISLGKKAAAAEAYRRAHELNSDDPKAINNLAVAYIGLEDWVSAVALLKGATERFGDDATMWLNLGRAQKGLGNTEGAVASFEAAIASDPQNARGRAHTAAIQLARHFLSVQDYPRVLAAAETVLGFVPESTRGWFYQGLAQQAMGDHAGARRSLEQARRLDPADPHTHNNLGNVYRELGLLEQAAAAFQRALDIDPSLREARDNLDAVRGRLEQQEAGRSNLPGAAPPRRPPPPPPPPPRPPPPPPRLGLRFADIDYSALGIQGVMVETVEPGTLASRAGLQPKDLILKIDGRDVTSPEGLESYVGGAGKPSVVLDLLRDNLPRQIEMRLE